MGSQEPKVTLTNAEKVLYPETGADKAAVYRYYTTVAEVMLPHIAGRPATRKRWPNGVDHPAFFEKQLASSAPAWLHRGSLNHRSGVTVYPIIDSVDALAWIAQQAALEVHVPQWRFVDTVHGPATRLVFDLDPGEDVDMAQLATVARAVRAMLSDIGLTAYPVTSGSKGLHLYAPFAEPVSSHGATVLAKRIAQQLESDMPSQVTAVMAKSQRAGKVFLDWSQNSGSKTTVAPYSLRGRPTPTVAAPRTWDELDDPGLRQLRFDEVLERVARDGDLLEGLDSDIQGDRLSVYRSMRDGTRTPEPVPQQPPTPGAGNSFVIHEHHARRLHFDFRLERDGVLVSWAIPKNLPMTPAVNHLAVHTEDHPLEYGGFEGDIPKGEYGAGKVIIWDSGTYDTEKFRDDGEGGEVIVNLHGSKVTGRYALIQTGGKNWLAHRTKDQPQPAPADLAPMLATPGSVAKLKAAQWAFEGKWDGHRMLVDADHGTVTLRSRTGRMVTAEFPQLRDLAADLTEHHVLLDGEVVALGDDGTPSLGALQNRTAATPIAFWAFDILYLDGRSLLKAKLRDRRKLLETLTQGTTLVVPPQLDGDGAQALEVSRDRGWEGVIAKKWDSTYQPGRRSASWLKDKNWKTQDVVIGGWRVGDNGRAGRIGALLMGIPDDEGLAYAGRVGTGFTEKDLSRLSELLDPLSAQENPFSTELTGPEAVGVTFVTPTLVGEVRYGERTADGRLRHSSWRGLRPDKPAAEVRYEG
ncbi:ATP-dependent DNA ligase [Mycolicibacterium brumae]|uniref:DNA ligase (ATP) n=1 Tax=Mycolicibacterium brumae TaxID=85968 RepID=A0A2G5PAL2_9MYCO|nr:ATP-dependent DNA ligase [Mycolicibacterium brumae]MCV7193086.1 ATP-dependent DNA ligase [Mycolicibacterium brumae]PIB75398.1 ATP-dependent DNA ligase [Mycolicibacterium brumae]RWA21990.1 hypothetical protein MBRU_13470 [Mycolicibacterium brumae DSM 44177]UWW07912.1 ATP-dependent DNA ligase [Mycolicibacterium brumae]